MNISGDQFIGLVAISLMLMLVWRTMARMRGSGRQRLGMALIWGAVFVLITAIAGAFGR